MQQGQGCRNPTDEDRCGAFLLGDAGDLRPVELSCSTKTLTSAPPAAEALLASLRTAIRGHDKLKQESLAEVAVLDIDGDGKKDRVLLASFEVVATADNVDAYDQPPRCQALLLDIGSAVFAISADACKAPGTSQRLLQAFKLEGTEGVVLHIAMEGGGGGGAFLVHVAQARSTPLPLPRCEGNG